MYIRILTAIICFFLFSSRSYALANGGRFAKVLIIVLENTDYELALRQPFLKAMAAKGALLQNMNGLTHPSQGNYISMLAGDTLQVKNDDNYNFPVINLVDLLEKNGLTWKGYIEGFPGGCFTGQQKNRYVRKHNPFISFTTISSNQDRCSLIQNEKNFEEDAKAGKLPNFSIFAPNLLNDGHDTGVAFASKWLEANFAKKFEDPEFMKDLLVVITFDESSNRKGNHIYTVLLGDMVTPGAVNNQALNHINILKMIEVEFNIGHMGRMDASAQSIDGVWVN